MRDCDGEPIRSGFVRGQVSAASAGDNKDRAWCFQMREQRRAISWKWSGDWIAGNLEAGVEAEGGGWSGRKERAARQRSGWTKERIREPRSRKSGLAEARANGKR